MPSTTNPQQASPSTDAHTEARFKALRAWRTEQARAAQLPPYIIATDACLRSIAQANPGTLNELANARAHVHGVAGAAFGPAKVARYGAEVLAVLATVKPQAFARFVVGVDGYGQAVAYGVPPGREAEDVASDHDMAEHSEQDRSSVAAFVDDLKALLEA